MVRSPSYAGPGTLVGTRGVAGRAQADARGTPGQRPQQSKGAGEHHQRGRGEQPGRVIETALALEELGLVLEGTGELKS